MPSGVSFFILLRIGEALVQAFLLFFFLNAEKKSSFS